MIKRIGIDWQQIALNLRQSGRPLTWVAKQIGCDEATINRLARGDVLEPRFSVGIQLLDLHYDLFPELHTTLRTRA